MLDHPPLGLQTKTLYASPTQPTRTVHLVLFVFYSTVLLFSLLQGLQSEFMLMTVGELVRSFARS
jgi:hypothetical protein